MSLSREIVSPTKFEKWGISLRGFHSDTIKGQAPVIFQVRDVPGVPHDQKGWVLLALHIHNNKKYNVDRRDSPEPRSICFLFFGVVIGIVIISFIIAVIVFMFGCHPSYYVRG